jgi:Spy/CpxP family protein refolding chaperone
MIGRPIKAKAFVFVLFLMGIATGVLVANIYSSRVASAPAPPVDRSQRTQRAQRDINKFYDYLGLNQEQRDQMHKIGEETRQKFQDLRKETQPRFEAIQEASRVKIRAVLNEEQRQKYDDFRKKMDEQRRSHERDSGKDSGSNKNNQGPRQ